jgi:hypothetical protein
MMNGTRRIRDSARMSGVEIGVLLDYRSDLIGDLGSEKKVINATPVASGASSAR